MKAFAGFLVSASFLVLVIGLIKPAWVLPRVKQPSRMKAVGSAVLIFVVAIIVGVSSEKPQTASAPSPSQSSAEQAAAPPPPSVTSAPNPSQSSAKQAAAPPSVMSAPSVPADEASLLQIVDRYRADYAAAANDMAKGAVRPARATAICALLRSDQAKDWIGTVATLLSTNDGKGVLRVSAFQPRNGGDDQQWPVR
jgi:hypothetical protein